MRINTDFGLATDPLEFTIPPEAFLALEDAIHPAQRFQSKSHHDAGTQTIVLVTPDSTRRRVVVCMGEES